MLEGAAGAASSLQHSLKAAATGTARRRLQCPSLELEAAQPWMLAAAVSFGWGRTGAPDQSGNTQDSPQQNKTVLMVREMRFVRKKIIFWIILEI